MRNRISHLAALTAVVGMVSTLLFGCSNSLVNSYLLDEANVGGDAARTIKPIQGVLVWPLENIAAGTKSKGVETRLTGVLYDTIQLHGTFEKVVLLEEDQAKDLMARAGEELGLKKKPKMPGDGALIATKLGQLTGTEVILTGRIEEFDEEKVDKATITVVAASFNVLDAREKVYSALDSFVPAKRVWRTNAKRESTEGPFSSRERLDETARALLENVVDRLASNLGTGAKGSNKALKEKVSELDEAAEKNFDAGEFDKAIAGWNEIIKIQPGNKSAKKRIEAAEKEKIAATEKAKAAASRAQIDEIKGKAEAAAKAGDLEEAIGEWKKILAIDKANKEALKNVESLEKKVADRKKKDDAEAEKKAAAEAPRAVERPRAVEAPKAVEPPRAVEPPKAVETPKPVEAPKAVEAPKPVEPPKAVEAPKPVEPPKAVEKNVEAEKPTAVAPAGGGDLEAIRNQAMAAFNKEDYPASRDLWKQILAKSPDDKQAKEMLETTEMLLNALK